jgi:cytochrome b6-f complex iron-sulfur subunit
MNEKTNEPNLSRRRFLTLLTHGGWVAAMGVLVYQMGRFMSARDMQSIPTPLVIAGTPDDFPPGSTTYVSQARAWVENDQGTLRALDAVCTHMGCIVQERKTAVPGFQCPCHGSEYGEDGSVEQGPAERPLRPLHIEVTPDDRVVIRT